MPFKIINKSHIKFNGNFKSHITFEMTLESLIILLIDEITKVMVAEARPSTCPTLSNPAQPSLIDVMSIWIFCSRLQRQYYIVWIRWSKASVLSMTGRMLIELIIYVVHSLHHWGLKGGVAYFVMWIWIIFCYGYM